MISLPFRYLLIFQQSEFSLQAVPKNSVPASSLLYSHLINLTTNICNAAQCRHLRKFNRHLQKTAVNSNPEASGGVQTYQVITARSSSQILFSVVFITFYLYTIINIYLEEIEKQKRESKKQ